MTWHKESHRHYLAAKGISTKRYMKNKYFMPAIFQVPHWLLNQLDEEQKVEANKMLFEDGMKINIVAEHFGISHPQKGNYQKPKVVWTEEQKISYIQDLYKRLGRVPQTGDIEVEEGVPSYSGLVYAHNGSWNDLLRSAGIEPVFQDVRNVPVERIISKFNKVPEGIEERREMSKSLPDVKARLFDRQKELSQTPKYRLKNKEYRQRPEVKDYMKTYREDNREQIKEYNRVFSKFPEQRERRNAYSRTEKAKKYAREFAMTPVQVEKRRQYNLDNKEKRRQYNLDNKEKIKEYKIQYKLRRTIK